MHVVDDMFSYLSYPKESIVKALVMKRRLVQAIPDVVLRVVSCQL